ncbi:hypothetical protein BH11ACT2_BH11ACT2_14100 [soil metagenome]
MTVANTPEIFGEADSPLLSMVSALVNRFSSHRFQALHATRIDNGLDTVANSALYLLCTDGPSRPSAIADYLGTGRANASKVINRLETLGYVAKSPDPADSRASIVALTSSGFEVSRDVIRVGDDMMREITADWSPDEIDNAALFLERINLGAAAYEARLAREASE